MRDSKAHPPGEPTPPLTPGHPSDEPYDAPPHDESLVDAAARVARGVLEEGLDRGGETSQDVALRVAGSGPVAGARNRLLRTLPASEYGRVSAELERVELPERTVLYEPDAAITHIYFPETAICSITAAVDALGAPGELATIGREGMLGLPVFLDAGRGPNRALCQMPGASTRMPSDVFREVVEECPAFHTLLHRYTQALIVQITRSAACDHMHTVEQRCARWLLVTEDRVGSATFRLTQEMLAQMLAVRRPSVTVAAGILQRAGLISYHRGRITIRDRRGLEAASCGCYGVITREYARLLGAFAD